MVGESDFVPTFVAEVSNGGVLLVLLFQQTTKRLKKSRQLKRCFDNFKIVWKELCAVSKRKCPLRG